MKSIIYACLVTIMVFTACSSGKSTFERGNYYDAVITSVNRLRRNSDHKKSVETLRLAYPMAVSFYEDRANTAIASTQVFKWSQVVNAYTTINNMYDEIKRCPGALRVIPDPVNYFSKLKEARQNAAEENYAAGITALQFDEREKAKQAYAYFKTAHGFVPGYKDVINYMEAALDAATVKILVEPIPVHSKTVGVSAEFFNDKISEFVHTAPINEFVRFYTRAEAETIKLNPDHIIQLEFDEFTVGQVYKYEKEIQLRKDSVVMGTYVTPSVANEENTSGNSATSGGRSGLTSSGRRVLASTHPPANSDTDTSEAEKEREEREAAAKQQAEAERARAERLRAEREAAEKVRLAREAAQAVASHAEADKNEIAKAQAEKALAEKIKAEKEQAAKEAAAKALAEKEKAEREHAEKARIAKERAEKEAAEKARLEREKVEQARIEKERAEKEAAAIALAAKEQADREKAEKEQTAEIYVDPTIKSTDTLNVIDPVKICHVPPGNHMKRRTLVISRSALKAHLGHGDIEGGCEGDKEELKEELKEEHKKDGTGKPEKDPRPKAKPEGNPKGKGSGALKIQNNNEQSFLHVNAPVYFASTENAPEKWFRYMAYAEMQPDTNKVYGTVKATLYHHKKTTTAKGIVSFRIIDAKTGALLSVEKMPGEFVWVSEWAYFNGDERALSPEQLNLTRLKEQPAPAPQELFIEFTRPIYDQITTKIREFYKGY